ncbi:MAG: FxsA family protein [Alysiella sp.]|uniref:FxsA family protein n=1 Tax=Alysiella sp. TaxID=1872483 RepID=UPI0026DC88E4|nr:FxsA family protein [Alysiella sp.]MDO4433848.1 FxsA family protein [Alysiella sp.]
MRYLGLAFLILLAIEIFSIMVMAKLLGGLTVFILMILSFILGLFILRRTAGFAKVLMAGELLRGQGGISFYQMMWPVRIPIAGVLLMSPGFVSTFGALMLLLPFKGKPLAQQHTSQGTRFGGFEFGHGAFYGRTRQNHDEDIIEGDFTVHTHTTKQAKRQQGVIEHKNHD